MLLQNTQLLFLRTRGRLRSQKGEKLQRCPCFQKGRTSQEKRKTEQNTNLSICGHQAELEVLSNQPGLREMDLGPGPTQPPVRVTGWVNNCTVMNDCIWASWLFGCRWINQMPLERTAPGLRRFYKYLLLLGEKLIQPCELDPLTCRITSAGHNSVCPGQSPLPPSGSVSPVTVSAVSFKVEEGWTSITKMGKDSSPTAINCYHTHPFLFKPSILSVPSAVQWTESMCPPTPNS